MNGIRCKHWAAVFFMALLVFPLQSGATEVWLMTYGTGDQIEERFGHNALWVRDPDQDMDSIYNFGFFDFDQPGFYKNYLFGRMMYFAVARDPAEELSYYRWRDRQVLAQRLNLNHDQIDRLIDWLELQTSPENRYFRYDYYFNNCSNRVRDGLDHALSGWLKAQTEMRTAGRNFRSETRRLIQDTPWLYLGIHTGLGRMVDRPRSVWEAMFLPQVVADQVRTLVIESPEGNLQPFVLEERVLHSSSRDAPPRQARKAVGLFFMLGVITVLLILMPLLLFRHETVRLLPVRIWMLLSAMTGSVLIFLWLCTDHQAAWNNENLLLLNPLLLVLWRFRFSLISKISAVLVGLGLIFALGLKFFDGAQWNYDLIVWWWPAQCAVLWLWYRCCKARLTCPDRT